MLQRAYFPDINRSDKNTDFNLYSYTTAITSLLIKLLCSLTMAIAALGRYLTSFNFNKCLSHFITFAFAMTVNSTLSFCLLDIRTFVLVAIEYDVFCTFVSIFFSPIQHYAIY